MRIVFYIFMGCAITSNAFGEDPIQQRLDQLYAEYEATIANPTVKKYVELDRKLRAFISEELRKFDGLVKIEKPEDYYKYDNERTRALGIETSKYAGGTYSQALVYSEKFLVQAHKMNPDSKYRVYTLFSQILGVRSYHGLGEMPNIKVAYQYAKAFPNGPFIADVYRIIASFHMDLFGVVRRLSEGKEKDFLYDCYKPYVERRPYEEQMAQNKRIALRYYAKFKEALGPGVQHPWWYNMTLDDLKIGNVNTMNFCSD